MKPETVCQKIGQWFQKHKNENPFTFGEVHLATEEPEADIVLVIGQWEKKTDGDDVWEPWKNTTYDAPVTWLWQKLADEDADAWLQHIYTSEASDMKRRMLNALLELAQLIEENSYTLDWEAQEDQPFRTHLHINHTSEKTTIETDRWTRLLKKSR